MDAPVKFSSRHIDRMLNISTGHLSEKTCNAWMKDQDVVCAIEHDYGWIVWVNEKAEGLPNDLQFVLRFARNQACDYVKFDCDAAVLEELPVYDW